MNNHDPLIKKFQSTEHALAWLLETHCILAFKEDFVAHRKQEILTIHVAAVGYDNIEIYNPEYTIRWYETIGVRLRTLYRMAKSNTARESLTKAFRIAYTKIDDHEYVDAFEKQVHEANPL